jgi:hypothetical protein
MGSGRTTLLWIRELHHGLKDENCVVDGATDSGRGRWQCIRASTVVGNNVRRLWGGLDDGKETLGMTRQ